MTIVFRMRDPRAGVDPDRNPAVAAGSTLLC